MRILPFLFPAMPAGLALLCFTVRAGGPPADSPPPIPLTATPAPAVAGGRIPEEKGSTTQAGKFVPAAAVPAADTAQGAPLKPEEAEKKLQAALKVEELAPGKFRVGQVKFDAAARTVSLPAKVNLRGGVIEYVLTTEAGKAHESMLTTKASPRDLHMACLLLGMKGAPLTGGAGEAMKLQPAESVRISVSWETNGPPVTVPLAALLQLKKSGDCCDSARMADGPWQYTGSRFMGSGTFAAEVEGSFISLIRDDSALLNNPDESRDNDEVHQSNPDKLPPGGTPVTIVFQLPAKA
jgi:hypothetical protein